MIIVSCVQVTHNYTLVTPFPLATHRLACMIRTQQNGQFINARLLFNIVTTLGIPASSAIHKGNTPSVCFYLH